MICLGRMISLYFAKGEEQGAEGREHGAKSEEHGVKRKEKKEVGSLKKYSSI